MGGQNLLTLEWNVTKTMVTKCFSNVHEVFLWWYCNITNVFMFIYTCVTSGKV